MASLFIIFVPIIIIVLVILLITAVRGNSERGGEEMIKNVYVYLVLFATLMMTIGGSVAAFMAAADIVAPTPYYQSFEEYKRWSGGPEKPGEESQQLSEEELRRNYDSMVASHKENAVERAKNNLIKSFGWIVIPLPIFIYFQRQLNRKRD
ncbi:hypothetical protein BKP35_11845 [Anaerobacillus arseniciselenatis]|uniref:Uncharacterized protein n=1 Tax=Anaerobacillus arseniciselenatis TaxID=85682 RepID=A0A1S2LH34_9BACI|nr:hypothetical protein [Anaerobacillus arseniciselenatis]OIJ11624.1 hypothetical protein BKP35_11845 [Anaerobacillus arseniciselenatis]